MQAHQTLIETAAAANDRFASESLRVVALRHRRVSLTLAGVLMGLYVAFMLLIAFAKPLLGTLVMPGISLGLLLGVGMIVFSWLLACGYVFWANRFHDAACRRLA